jgi:hypothetical protein
MVTHSLIGFVNPMGRPIDVSRVIINIDGNMNQLAYGGFQGRRKRSSSTDHRPWNGTDNDFPLIASIRRACGEIKIG